LFDVIHVKKAGNSYGSALFKQIYALQYMYEHANDAKWFYVIGCDTYFIIDYLLTTLEPYDADKPFFLGCCAGDYDLKRIGINDTVYFPSGGPGMFLSKGSLLSMIDIRILA
jgi:hypothetical protein